MDTIYPIKKNNTGCPDCVGGWENVNSCTHESALEEQAAKNTCTVNNCSKFGYLLYIIQ